MALDATNPRTLLANLTIPASPTSVVIGGLVTNTAYSIQAAAWTLMGLGPTSPPVVHQMEAANSFTKTIHSDSPPSLAKQPLDDENSDGGSVDVPQQGVTQVVQETWFILLLGGILLAILCLLVAALLVRRNLAKKKALSALSKSEPIGDPSCHGTIGVAGSVRGRDAFWSRGWSTSIGNAKEVDAQATLLPHGNGTASLANRPLVAPPEYAELLGHCVSHDPAQQQQHQHQQHPGQLSLSSFLPRRNPAVQQPHPAAYATTTLVAHRSNGVQQQQHNVNHDPYAASCSAFSASDSSGYTTDELGDRCRRAYPSGKSTKSRQSTSSQGNVVKLLPNLGELLPPPPRHPPPSSPSPAAFDRPNNEVHCNLYMHS